MAKETEQEKELRAVIGEHPGGGAVIELKGGHRVFAVGECADRLLDKILTGEGTPVGFAKGGKGEDPEVKKLTDDEKDDQDDEKDDKARAGSPARPDRARYF